jgi:hypothetical protein
MSAVATAIVGGAVISGVVASNAAQSAASTQAGAATTAAGYQLQATQETNALNWDIYQQNLANISPYLQVSQEAEAALASGLGLAAPTVASQPGANANTTGVAEAGTVGQMTASGPTGGVQATPGGGTGGAPPGQAVAPPSGAATPTTGVMAPRDMSATPNTLAGYAAAQGTGPQTTTPGQTQAVQAGGTAAAPGTTPVTNIPGIGTPTVSNVGASSSQLAAGTASQQPGSLLASFNNADLTQQLAPSYAFMLQQGEQQTKASDAALGILQTGQGAKDVTQYAENYASTGYQQAFTNYITQQQANIQSLSSLANNGSPGAANNAGTSAAQTITGNTQTGTSNINSLLTSGAAATAAGQVGTANAISGAISGGTSNYLTSQIINKYLQGGTTTPPPTVAPTSAGGAPIA